MFASQFADARDWGYGPATAQPYPASGPYIPAFNLNQQRQAAKGKAAGKGGKGVHSGGKGVQTGGQGVQRHGRIVSLALDAGFSNYVHNFFERVMDANLPSRQLEAEWSKVLAKRDSLLCSNGMQKKTAASTEAADVNWKQSFREAYVKQKGGAVEKDELLYVSVDAELGGTVPMFIGTVSCSLRGWSYTGEPKESKKAAEQHAAMVGMLDLFPDQEAHQNAAPIHVKKSKLANPADGQPGARKKGEAPEDAKSWVAYAMQLLYGRSVVKGDAEYINEEVEGGVVCRLRLTEYSQDVVYTGEVSATKKAAEQSAAAAARVELEAVVAPLAAERAIIKQQENQDKYEAYTLKKMEEEAKTGGTS